MVGIHLKLAEERDVFAFRDIELKRNLSGVQWASIIDGEIYKDIVRPSKSSYYIRFRKLECALSAKTSLKEFTHVSLEAEKGKVFWEYVQQGKSVPILPTISGPITFHVYSSKRGKLKEMFAETLVAPASLLIPQPFLSQPLEIEFKSGDQKARTIAEDWSAMSEMIFSHIPDSASFAPGTDIRWRSSELSKYKTFPVIVRGYLFNLLLLEWTVKEPVMGLTPGDSWTSVSLHAKDNYEYFIVNLPPNVLPYGKFIDVYPESKLVIANVRLPIDECENLLADVFVQGLANTNWLIP